MAQRALSNSISNLNIHNSISQNLCIDVQAQNPKTAMMKIDYLSLQFILFITPSNNKNH